MPRRSNRARIRRVLDELTALRRYDRAAKKVGLQEWEIKKSKRWIARQPLNEQLKIAEKAEQVVRERLHA